MIKQLTLAPQIVQAIAMPAMNLPTNLWWNSNSRHHFAGVETIKSHNALRMIDLTVNSISSLSVTDMDYLYTILDNLPSGVLENSFAKYSVYDSQSAISLIVQEMNVRRTAVGRLSALEEHFLSLLNPLTGVLAMKKSMMRLHDELSNMKNLNEQGHRMIAESYHFAYVAPPIDDVFWHIINTLNAWIRDDRSMPNIDWHATTPNVESINALAENYFSQCYDFLYRHQLAGASPAIQIHNMLSSWMPMEYVQYLLAAIKQHDPSFDVNQPENILKVASLINDMVLGDPALGNLSKDPDMQALLGHLLSHQDLSNVDLQSLANMLAHMNWSNYDFSNLNFESLNLNNISSLPLQTLTIAQNMALIQKIVMGVAAGVAGALGVTTGVLTRSLFKKNAAKKIKTFVGAITIALTLAAAGLILGIFLN